jgi:hypothetical protein
MKMRRSAVLLVLFVSAGLLSVTPAQAAPTLSGACNGTASGDFNGDFWDDLAVGVPGEDIGAANDGGAVDVQYGSDTGLSDTEEDPQFFTQDTAGIGGGAEDDDQFGGCVAAGDFNGDGFDDLAIGAPGEGVTTTKAVAATGAITILLGSENNGLTATGSQLWHQDSAKVPGVNEKDDEWGSALAAGDFDGDERDDLVVGSALEDVQTRLNAGAATILYGANAGLTGVGSQIFYQDVKNVAGVSEGGDFFGRSLATGDIDGNGNDDLVVGVPGEDVGRALVAGAIQTFLGTPAGITVARNRIWHQDSPGVIGTVEDDDRFGAAVTVGDFDGDGFEDVAVGVPSEDLNDPDIDEGVVQAFYGTETGPTAAADQMFSADSLGFASQDGALFGSSLTTGDVDDDSAADLLIGAPLEDETVLVEDDAGAVYYVPGNDPGGLDDAAAQQFFAEDLGDTSVGDDFLGYAITNGDYDGTLGADFAVGSPGQDESEDEAGAVDVIFSDGAVPDTGNTQHLTQADGEDDEEDGDAFGSALG